MYIISFLDDLNNSLTANNTQFIFDYQVGQYGYNTDPARSADSFVPFGNANGKVVTRIASNISFGSATIDCKSLNNYDKLSAANFILDLTSTNSHGRGVSANTAGYTIDAYGSNTIKKTYNQSTGILTITGGSTSGSGGGSSLSVTCDSSTTGDVYCIQ